MNKNDSRINPCIQNYFIGDQYKCQDKCVFEGFWTEQRITNENNNGSKPVFEWAMELIDFSQDCSVLDVGCGPSQKVGRMLGTRNNLKVVGIDSPEAINLSKKFNPTGEYYVCDLDSDVEIATLSSIGFFDVIFCLDVIEHVLFPEKTLNFIKAHATRNTKVFFATAERDLTRGELSVLKGSNKLEHVREWNVMEFKELVEYVGFMVEKVKIFEHPQTPREYIQTLLCSLRHP